MRCVVSVESDEEFDRGVGCVKEGIDGCERLMMRWLWQEDAGPVSPSGRKHGERSPSMHEMGASGGGGSEVRAWVHVCLTTMIAVAPGIGVLVE